MKLKGPYHFNLKDYILCLKKLQEENNWTMTINYSVKDKKNKKENLKFNIVKLN